MGTQLSRRAALIGGGAVITLSVPAAKAISMVPPERPDYFCVSGHVRWFCERWGLGSIRGQGPNGERVRDLIFTPPLLEARGHTTTRMGTRVVCLAEPVPRCHPQVVQILSINSAPDPLWEQSYLVDIIGYDIRTERIRTITSETDEIRCKIEVLLAAGIEALELPTFAQVRLAYDESCHIQITAIERHRPGTRWYGKRPVADKYRSRPVVRLTDPVPLDGVLDAARGPRRLPVVLNLD